MPVVPTLVTAVRPASDSEPFVGFASTAASSKFEPIVMRLARLTNLVATQKAVAAILALPYRRSMATRFDPIANCFDLSVARTYLIFQVLY